MKKKILIIRSATGLMLTGVYDFVRGALKVGWANEQLQVAAGFAPADAITAQEFASGTFAKLQSPAEGLFQLLLRP